MENVFSRKAEERSQTRGYSSASQVSILSTPDISSNPAAVNPDAARISIESTPEDSTLRSTSLRRFDFFWSYSDRFMIVFCEEYSPWIKLWGINISAFGIRTVRGEKFKGFYFLMQLRFAFYFVKVDKFSSILEQFHLVLLVHKYFIKADWILKPID